MSLHTAKIFDWVEGANVWLARAPLMSEGSFNPVVVCPSYYVTLPTKLRTAQSIDRVDGLKFVIGMPREVPVRTDIVFFSTIYLKAFGCVYLGSGCRRECIDCGKIAPEAPRNELFVTNQPHNAVFHPGHGENSIQTVLGWTFSDELSVLTSAARRAFESLTEFPGVEIRRQVAA